MRLLLERCDLEKYFNANLFILKVVVVFGQFLDLKYADGLINVKGFSEIPGVDLFSCFTKFMYNIRCSRLFSVKLFMFDVTLYTPTL